MLIKGSSGSSDRKIKPIINVRHYIGAKGKNNTAFYFKTDKNYYFVTVLKDQIHLGIEKVAVTAHNEATYTHYLTFAPMPLENCPRLEPPSAGHVVDGSDGPNKSAVSATVEADDGEVAPVKSSVSTPGSSTGSDPANSPSLVKGHGVIASADSGVESEARDSQEDESATLTPTAAGLVGGD